MTTARRDDLRTIEHAAEILGFSPEHRERLVNGGEIGAARLNDRPQCLADDELARSATKRQAARQAANDHWPRLDGLGAPGE